MREEWDPVWTPGFRSGLNNPVVPRAQLMACVTLVPLTSVLASLSRGSVRVCWYFSPNPLQSLGRGNALGH